VASERIKAYRKDVLSRSGKGLYIELIKMMCFLVFRLYFILLHFVILELVVGGGDVTRKKKLLEKQKEGKKRLKQSGKVTLSQEAFNAVISRS
jgi:hypothetical protein